jgi:hypothetical protein
VLVRDPATDAGAATSFACPQKCKRLCGRTTRARSGRDASVLASADALALSPGSGRLTQPAVHYLFLNTRVPPFDDVWVRRAVNFAVDRRAVVRAFGWGSAVATCQVLPPNFPGYQRYCPYHAPQLRAARRLIQASGTRGARVVAWTNPFLAAEARAIVPVLRRRTGDPA